MSVWPVMPMVTGTTIPRCKDIPFPWACVHLSSGGLGTAAPLCPSPLCILTSCVGETQIPAAGGQMAVEGMCSFPTGEGQEGDHGRRVQMSS